MKTHHHPTTFVHLINQIGLLGICVALVVAFYYQLVRHELPCPICLLQRAGLIIAGFGFLFNLCFGLRGIHYDGNYWQYPDRSYGIPANMFAYHAR